MIRPRRTPEGGTERYQPFVLMPVGGGIVIVMVSWLGGIIMRPKNAKSRAAIDGRHWLVEKKAACQSPLLGGRTGTRALPGFVATRWRDGVSYAEQRK